MYVKLFYAQNEQILQDDMNDFLERIEDDEDIKKIYVALSNVPNTARVTIADPIFFTRMMGLIAYKGDMVEESPKR